MVRAEHFALVIQESFKEDNGVIQMVFLLEGICQIIGGRKCLGMPVASRSPEFLHASQQSSFSVGEVLP